jgi:large subunit ribosomal protein L4
MLIKVMSLDNVEVDQIEIIDEFYPSEIRQDIIKRVIDWQLVKAMSGCHKSKTRSEVSGTGKKPFAQKGTGRARQGSTRGPHMRGGATVHGPVIRSHEIKLSKKFRKLGLRHALATKYFAQQMTVVNDLTMSEVSTAAFCKKISWLNNGKNILFVDKEFDNNFKMSCANKFTVNILPEIGLNVYDLIKNEYLVITQSSLKRLEERLINNEK